MWQIYTRRVERPVTTSWLLWLVIGIILFWASFEGGSRWDTTLPAIFVGVLNPVLILLISFKYGEYRWGKIDYACVLICLVTVLVWKITNSPLLGLLGGIFADMTAAIPQLFKNWSQPYDEVVFPWLMFSCGSAINFLAIEIWEPTYYLFPLWMTIGSLCLVAPIILHKINWYKPLAT